MPEITGTVLLVQESRVRLLTDDGRARIFLLAPEAPVEPQDLTCLPGRRVQLRYRAAPKFQAGVVTEFGLLP